MTKISSTMLSVGTLLRRAEDTGSEVRVLVQGCWLDGRVIGCDGLGAVLDDGNGQQVLVRLESVVAVTFSRAQMDDDPTDAAWRHGHQREPIEAGPVTSSVTVPAQSSGGFEFIPAGQY
ncbi:hypothetical protein [Nocardioides sp.]|uniref:hypothetical protein n=1 Tax=Nocardioides sp. TaxID=35761 RepID=UPI00260B0198|nr:hypothetical protein [Nocardioides sp.]MCW2738436.1 hypothetical protein [Nocardioides sp.]